MFDGDEGLGRLALFPLTVRPRPLLLLLLALGRGLGARALDRGGLGRRAGLGLLGIWGAVVVTLALALVLVHLLLPQLDDVLGERRDRRCGVRSELADRDTGA
jgi:hypothetical protein